MLATTRQRRESSLKKMLGPAVAVALLSYFGYHAFNGELGLVGKAAIENQVAELETELAALKEERLVLQRRVFLLMPDSLDPDMVDERARASLNLVHPNEVAILRR